MFSSTRNAVGRVLRSQRPARTLARRLQILSQNAQPERRRNALGMGICVGAGLGLAGWYTANAKVVRLDSPEKPKPKRVPKETKPSDPEVQAPEASSSTSTSKTEDFLQKKEDEAIEEAASKPPSSESDSEAESSGAAGGAFNPETGEINWDCPCLGGMAHGPCGQEFRDAFSCFVYSEEEPKGINCVEKFKAMQDCFRRHPEVYGEEIMADDDDDENEAPVDGELLQDPAADASPLPEATPAVPQTS